MRGKKKTQYDIRNTHDELPINQYGPGIDEPICFIDVDGQTETKYYYHFDGLGSVAVLLKIVRDKKWKEPKYYLLGQDL